MIAQKHVAKVEVARRPRDARFEVMQSLAVMLEDSFRAMTEATGARETRHGALLALQGLLARTGVTEATSVTPLDPPSHAATLPSRYPTLSPPLVRCNLDAPEIGVDPVAFDLAVLGLCAADPAPSALELRVVARPDCVALVIPNPALTQDVPSEGCQIYWRAGRVGQAALGGAAYADTARGEWVLRLPARAMVGISPPGGQVEEFR